MKRIITLYTIFSLCSLGLFAQQNIVESLQQPVQGQGTVVVHQDDALGRLLGTQVVRSATSVGGRHVVKAAGYRVQIYMGNNSRQSKLAAQEAASYIRSNFSDMTAYAQFSSPRWVCRVGDYRSMEQADAALRRIRATGRFREASIVRTQVNIME